MARKKIREHDAKRLLLSRFQAIAGRTLPIKVAQVKPDTDMAALLKANPWLTTTKLVVKPDMLFGQRGKNDLLGLNMDWPAAEAFIRERMGRVVTVNGCTGPVTTFIVEPFVPHDLEYYICIQSERLHYEISFCEAGGVNIEENWDKLKNITVETLQALNGDAVAPLISSLPLEQKPRLEKFIMDTFKVFLDVDATLLEMNPFTFDPASGEPFPLDMRMELDDTAKFRSGSKWGDVEFPLPFGRTMTPSEEYVHSLDEATGASLKFTVLNPTGRVWLMVAGGGASVIYTDTVGDLGYSQELGNYGEYSGAPNTQETYLYAKTVLECATSQLDGRGRALIIGGGIANFTDVAATFKGIIQALREYSEKMKAARMKLFVRRGGPNYQKGLELMRQLGQEIGLTVVVYGPEASMTGVCKEAIDHVQATAA